MSQPLSLRIEGARQNNLKNVSVAIPHDRVTVVTGVSGSGKSSLAFDTLFAEGQWRYIESLSTYARMFLERLDRPDVDRIEHIRPPSRSSRRTRCGRRAPPWAPPPSCTTTSGCSSPRSGASTARRCGAEARSDSADQVADALVRDHPGARALICFPLPEPRQDPAALFSALLQRGFARVKVGDDGARPGRCRRPPGGAARGAGRPAGERGARPRRHRRRHAGAGSPDSLETALAEGDGRR